MEKEMFCGDCLAHGHWKGQHDCPPWLKYLVSKRKAEMEREANPNKTNE